MATVNLTRTKRRHQKQHISTFTTDLALAETPTSADVYQLFELPPASMVVRAQAVVMTANDAGTSAVGDLGFDGGDELLDGVDLTSVAGTVLTDDVAGLIAETGGMVTWTPVYGGTAPTAGRVKIHIDYVEYEKTNGEVTNFASE